MRVLALLALLYPSLTSASIDANPSFTINQLHLYNERESRELKVLEAARQALMLDNLTPLQELSLYIPEEAPQHLETEHQYGQDYSPDEDGYRIEPGSTSETDDENGEYWEFL